MPAGCPTKYHPSKCDEYIALASGGRCLAEIAREWKVDRQTIYNWQKEFPEFFDAVKKGREFEQAWWSDQARDNLKNPKFNAVLWMMNQKIRFHKTDEPPINFKKGKTFAEDANNIATQLAAGNITPSQAASAMQTVAKAWEMTLASQLDQRIQALEDAKDG